MFVPCTLVSVPLPRKYRRYHSNSVPLTEIPNDVTMLHLVEYNCSLTGWVHVTLPNVTHLVLERCEKNYVWTELNAKRFPNLKALVVFSHPCGGGGGGKIQRAFPDTKIYASEQYRGHYDFYSGAKPVCFLTPEEEKAFLEKLQKSE